MGWLDKRFKNVLSGAKDFAQSPAGMLALGLAAPYMASYMAPGAAGGSWMTSMAGKKGITGALAKGISSPIVSNALKNAAINYGIATLTGSRHPGRSALWAAAASTPFTMMQAGQAAGAYNELLPKGLDAAGLAEQGLEKANWWDYALGKDMPSIPGLPIHGEGSPLSYKDTTDYLGHRVKDIDKFTDYHDVWPSEAYKNIGALPPGGPQLEPILSAPTAAPDIGGYFTREGGKALMEKAVTGQNPYAGIMGMLGVPGNLDVMATLVPQIAGMYGGRMSDEEKWNAWKQKRIKYLAWKYGIPEEDAERMITGEQANPFYKTLMPSDYGDIEFYNQGGYADDYTGGGQAVGPGTGTSDSIQPVALSDGEFVFTKAAVDNAGGPEAMYSMMNQLDPDSERPEEARV